jgi:hypothetical protein
MGGVGVAPEKRDQPVVIYTRRHRVEGTLVLLKGEQLSDRLNLADRKFEAVHKARVLSLDDDRMIHQTPYLAVNKDHIILALPADEE